MRVACNYQDDGAGLRGYLQFNKHTHTHAQDPSLMHLSKNTQSETQHAVQLLYVIYRD